MVMVGSQHAIGVPYARGGSNPHHPLHTHQREEEGRVGKGSNRVPQRDSTGGMPSAGPVAAPPCPPAGCVEVVAVLLSGGAVRLYRARPGCATREEVETACWALAWRDGSGRWHSLVAGVELRAEQTAWWDWSLSVQGMRVASPAPPRPVASPGRVAVDVVGWCQLAEGVRRWLRTWGFARERGARRARRRRHRGG